LRIPTILVATLSVVAGLPPNLLHAGELAAGDAAEPTPVLVELFTSEGCSSCPPADELLAELANAGDVAGARVIPLGFHVTYWDRLGWRDRFSDGRWTERQEDYARALRAPSVFTPQAVVGGTDSVVANQRGELLAAIARAARGPRGALELSLERHGRRLAVAGRLARPLDSPGATSWFALTESALATDVRRGENAHRRLRHAPVVRWRSDPAPLEADGRPGELVRATVDLSPEWDEARLQVVGVVQLPGPGRVLAVATEPLPLRADLSRSDGTSVRGGRPR